MISTKASTLVLFTITLFNFLHGQNPGFKKYSYTNTYAKLAFSFNIPQTWIIDQDKDGTGFMSTCKPTTKRELDIFNYCSEGIVFRLEYFHGNLDSALSSQSEYKKINDTYITSDRFNDSVPTKKLVGINWTGLYHKNTCGITCTDNGFHAAAGECEYIYFSDTKQTICITTNGRALEDTVLKEIISSFSFN